MKHVGILFVSSECPPPKPLVSLHVVTWQLFFRSCNFFSFSIIKNFFLFLPFQAYSCGISVKLANNHSICNISESSSLPSKNFVAVEICEGGKVVELSHTVTAAENCNKTFLLEKKLRHTEKKERKNSRSKRANNFPMRGRERERKDKRRSSIHDNMAG